MTLSTLLRQGIVRRAVSIQELAPSTSNRPNLVLDFEEAWPRNQRKRVEPVEECEITKVYRYSDLELLASKP